MTEVGAALDRVADSALAEPASVLPADDAVGAAIATARLLSRRAAEELADRDRVIRIARREGATLRARAEATGLSRQTVANICAGSEETGNRSRS